MCRAMLGRRSASTVVLGRRSASTVVLGRRSADRRGLTYLMLDIIILITWGLKDIASTYSCQWIKHILLQSSRWYFDALNDLTSCHQMEGTLMANPLLFDTFHLFKIIVCSHRGITLPHIFYLYRTLS